MSPEIPALWQDRDRLRVLAASIISMFALFVGVFMSFAVNAPPELDGSPV